MQVVLHLNGTFYKFVESPDLLQVIHWYIPSKFPNKISKPNKPLRFDHGTILDFYHCGCGHYYCHVSEEKEKRIRDIDKDT